MNKIPTLFLRSEENTRFLTRDINPQCMWIFSEFRVPTVKKDGTNIRITVGEHEFGNRHICFVEKRRNPSRKQRDLAEREGMPPPEPTYVLAYPEDPADKHIFAAVNATDFSRWPVGQWPCEALGPKIQGGVESDVPMLYPFSWQPYTLPDLGPLAIEYDAIMRYLTEHEIEGIVWHGVPPGRNFGEKMCKVKRKDFGLPWPPETKQ